MQCEKTWHELFAKKSTNKQLPFAQITEEHMQKNVELVEEGLENINENK